MPKSEWPRSLSNCRLMRERRKLLRLLSVIEDEIERRMKMAKDKDLVDERARYLQAMDAAYPEVGMPPGPMVIRNDAIRTLKSEGKIAADYTD